MRCVSPISIKDPRARDGRTRLTVPCAKCGACLANRRAQWSYRLAEELRHSSSAFFLTLTYSNESLSFDIKSRLPTLVKRHTQLFMKRLRKQQAKITNEKIRYYGVGEYGSTTHRPHYHFILFNPVIDLLENVHEIWKMGICHIGTVSASSIHYVTKYHVNVNRDMQQHRNPEFAVMSRRPGIGHQYLKRVGVWHKYRRLPYVQSNGYKQAIPRYYKEKLFNTIEKDLMSLEALYASDLSQAKEEERLKKQGYTNPSAEIEIRNYKQAQRIQRQAKSQDKL